MHDSSLPAGGNGRVFVFAKRLCEGALVTFDGEDLREEIIDYFKGQRKNGLYGRDSNDGSPSSSGSRYEFFLLEDKSILRIGNPFDSFWFEAWITKITDERTRLMQCLILFY